MPWPRRPGMGSKRVAVLLSWVQIRQLPRRAFLLAGDLGERREGLGIGVVVKHVLAGPRRAVGVPARLDHLGGRRRVVAGTAQPDTLPRQGPVPPWPAVRHAGDAPAEHPG